MGIKNISIKRIDNYFENPRHEVGLAEEDTLVKLFDEVGFQYMFNLAQDIYVNGFVNASLITVVEQEDSGRYIVYEGNRRIACVKLIQYPEKFRFLTKNQIDRIKKMKTEGPPKIPLDKITCLVTDEEDAFFIMQRLHSGEDKGRGVKAWNSKEKDNFVYRTSPQKGMKISKIISDKYYEYFRKDIRDRIAYTNIQRLFSNLAVKSALSIDNNNLDTFTKDKMEIISGVIDEVNKIVEEENSSISREFNKRQKIEDILLPIIDNLKNEHHANEDNNNPDNQPESIEYRKSIFIGNKIDLTLDGKKIVEYKHNDVVYEEINTDIEGLWEIKYDNGDICYLTILEKPDPMANQLVNTFDLGTLYNFDEIFTLSDCEGGTKVRPFNVQVLPERNRVLKEGKVTFSVSGKVIFKFSVKDKITEKKRDFEFHGEVKSAVQNPSTKYQPSIINSLVKTSEYVEQDIITFKNELNRIYYDSEYNLVFVSSVRTFVELIINDIVDQLGKSKSKDLSINYKTISKPEYIKDKFLNLIPDQREQAGVATIYKELVNSGRYNSILRFLNLTTHGAQRLITKERLISEFDVINLLYSYLCVLCESNK
ncbi:hypothetical protein [Enterococcus sp. DIV1444a]|uniref:hypothetical protein n=1 Tax=Enterococcus sp. DIV1444a TaxID=2774679 RepID=UPI003F253B99